MKKYPLAARREFEWFHNENPHIYDLFKKFARQAQTNGRSYFGARSIGERIRWYVNVETTDPEFKINDHFWPFYVRLLIQEDPSFATFFRQRKALADWVDPHNLVDAR